MSRDDVARSSLPESCSGTYQGWNPKDTRLYPRTASRELGTRRGRRDRSYRWSFRGQVSCPSSEFVLNASTLKRVRRQNLAFSEDCHRTNKVSGSTSAPRRANTSLHLSTPFGCAPPAAYDTEGATLADDEQKGAKPMVGQRSRQLVPDYRNRRCDGERHTSPNRCPARSRSRSPRRHSARTRHGITAAAMVHSYPGSPTGPGRWRRPG